MQERLVLDCAGSLCPRKLPGVSRLGLGEAGRYNDGVVRPGTAELLTGVEYSRVRSTAWIHHVSKCNYSYRSRTSPRTRKLPDPLGVGL